MQIITSTEIASTPTLQQRLRRRWVVGVMLFAAAVLNYIDRSVLGIVAPEMQKELGISDAGYAWIADAFLIAYTFSYLFSGRLVDRIGSRLCLGLFVGFWSIANALTGVARSFTSLAVFRFFLGLGEAGGYTASPKAVSDWFVPSERGIAVGMYSLGGSVGATIAPILVAATSANYGWRGAFFLTGILGLIWVVPWFWCARPPAAPTMPIEPVFEPKPLPVEAESSVLPYYAREEKKEDEKKSEWALWASLLREPAVWRLTLARLLTDAVLYFYIFWMPKYLAASWKVTQSHMGVMFYVFLAADIGFMGGGVLSGLLVKRGVEPPRSRVWIMAMAACLVPVSAAIPSAANLPTAIVLAAIVALGHCVWLGNISTLIVDIIPAKRLATAFGLIAAGSALGGIGMNFVVSTLISHYSYDAVFYVMTVLHPIALLIVWPVRCRKIAEV